MIQLRRMLLVNWHYIVHQVFDFEQVTFLTGKNGAGKSTILDALQLVVLGDTSGHYFNKAANDNSKRTLRGYLRGEVAEEEDHGVIYLRDGQFSSYIAVEFEDTRKRRRFCFGVVFDSYPDASYDHRFFSFDDALPDFHFIRDNVPLDIQALRQWGQRQRKRFEMYESNKRYQEVFLAKMGRLNEKFLRLFRKAVPFTPIMDVAGFISEFVCDVKHQVDIEDMRENIRHYRRMEQELEHVKKRIEALLQIQETYKNLETVRGRLRVYHYLLDRAEVQRVEDEVTAAQNRLSHCQTALDQVLTELTAADAEHHQWQDKRDRLVEERAQSDVYVKQQTLRAERQLLETQYADISRAGARQSRLLTEHRARWQAVEKGLAEAVRWFQAPALRGDGVPGGAGAGAQNAALAATGGHGVDLEAEADTLGAVASEYEQALRHLRMALAALPTGYVWQGRTLVDVDVEACRIDLGALAEAVEHFETVHEALVDAHRRIRDGLGAWEQEMRDLQQSIAELRRGIKQYDAPIVRLRQVLREGLKRQTGQDVPVEIFADLLEVKNPEWQPAIEGYLHTQRFYLIVPPEHFIAALRIYDEVKRIDKVFDVGLVDIGKILEEHPQRMPGCLAEEVETDNPYARAYADFLLGRVIKCDRVEDLRQHRTSITRDGMLYQSFVARQLNPRRWQTMYIGKRAIAQQLEQKTSRLAFVEQACERWRPRLQQAQGWSRQAVLTGADVEAARETDARLAELAALQEKLREVLDRLGSLDLTYLASLEAQIAECDQELAHIRARMDDLQRRRGNLVGERDRLEGEVLPELNQRLQDAKLRLASQHDPLFAADIGEPRYQQEMERLGSVDTLVANFARQRSTDANREQEYQRELIDQRAAYNRQFLAGFDIQRRDNDAYEEELRWLTESQATEYEEKIREAKERAQIQFQEDFISKLRSNIETVEQQIRDLNHAIQSVPFGRDRYHFAVRPNPQYERFYRMITDDMLLEGYGLFSQSFQERHGDTIEELFRNIVDVDEQDPMVQTELENNLKRFTDYRTYLDFDLVVKDEEGRQSRLSRVIAKKSGGETQTPFYISVLASFAQMYRVRQMGLDNTLRLIVFDEAYSKMDHQRIRESIRLTRELGLQLVLSAPTEKIADIVPHVDRTLVVTRIRSETRVSAFDAKRQGVKLG
ncbi:ATP-binding protein [Alicyclobacillus herbarius]|uniref:ATP-binding protein n=1 Tax=Alicyclobacillus herbarius TaxID=122960 RepID=UPI0003FF85E9|nr:SbcC/MukB-like Walker B domain-containing protein [Alicyclobacillus herbarius]